MRKISSNESKIAKILNDKRSNAYIDIYKENNFSGIGIIITEDMTVYKYGWHTLFSRETHNFNIEHSLYKLKNKINYEELEHFLIKEMNIIEKKYEEDHDDEEKSLEVIRLKVYESEFSNIELYDKIKEKVSTMIKEDL